MISPIVEQKKSQEQPSLGTSLSIDELDSVSGPPPTPRIPPEALETELPSETLQQNMLSMDELDDPIGPPPTPRRPADSEEANTMTFASMDELDDPIGPPPTPRRPADAVESEEFEQNSPSAPRMYPDMLNDVMGGGLITPRPGHSHAKAASM